MNKKIIAAAMCLLLITAVSLYQWKESSVSGEGNGEAVESNQTPVTTAAFSFEQGVPTLLIAGAGKVEHPAFIALYALSYMGKERFYDFGIVHSEDYAANCVRWLKEHAEDAGKGMKGWRYNFDHTYNDISLQAPWYSAFGQACGIEALVCWYEETGDAEALKLAMEAAEMLFIPIKEGGQLFVSGEDIWFEEIPSKDREPSHILNGHMRALIALRRLYDASGDEKIFDWYRRGAASLVHWMPLYDAGYWMRYDLNPKKNGLFFRFNNPYGEKLPELAIDEIRLEDPFSGESVSIDVGGQGDMNNTTGAYLAGVDWQTESNVDGHTVRRLAAVEPQPDFNTTNTKPNSCFYLKLPSEWVNNLRRDWLKLTIRYKDETQEDVVVEQRSIAPDEEFVTMRDGALLLTGSGEWREWSIPLRPQDLGWPVGMLYAEKHMQYLEALAADTQELEGWAEKVRGYCNTARIKQDTDNVLNSVKENEGGNAIPEQTVIFPCRSTDADKVVLQHNFSSINPPFAGEGYHSPFLIAAQALGDPSPIYFSYPESVMDNEVVLARYSWLEDADKMPYEAPRENAYRWLREYAVSVGDGLVWQMDKENAYNDLNQEPGWQSSFWQRYIIDAFIADGDDNMVRRAALAYGVPVEEGGLCSSWGGQKDLWFEEVPNKSHILNAHLASLVALHRVNEMYADETIHELEMRGLEDLRENLYRYDAGYWTKYDMNPQKNILFALVWEGEMDSPLLDELYLYNPVGNVAEKFDIGTEKDFEEGVSWLAGNLWRMAQIVDGRTARAIAVQQNKNDWNGAAFLHIALPYFELRDDFLLPDHYFVFRYKDTAKGKLYLFRQSIAEGNKLTMLPLPGAIVSCTGDNEWKTVVLRLPSQELGWYMGPDYQAFHNEQLGLVVRQTDDWYLKEHYEKWKYYLQAYQASQAG